jgi:hypothetical protein
MVYSNRWKMGSLSMLESSLGGNAEMNIFEIIATTIVAIILLFLVIGAFIIDCDRKRNARRGVTRMDLKIRKIAGALKRRFPWLFY